MTKEEAKSWILEHYGQTLDDGTKHSEVIKFVLKMMEQEPCEDAVSRQKVLEYIESSEAELGHSSENELVCRDIKEFLPVTPQPKSEVLDKIRAEIESIERYGTNNGHDIWLRTPEEIKKEVLKILDKYKAGSEE